MSNKSGMKVHAGRAILEESNSFTNEGKVVGEYVKNSWQYTDGPTTVNVLVDHKNKSIQMIGYFTIKCNNNETKEYI